MKFIYYILLLSIGLVSCEDLLTPTIENVKDVSDMYDDPLYAHGLLGSAYRLLPYSSAPNSDLSTDDAVSNQTNNNWSKLATGAWADNFNPASQWDKSYHAIQYLNIMLSIVDDVKWDSDNNTSILFRDRIKGEALGLRALQYFYLLKCHAGFDEDGNLLGVPYKTNVEDENSNFNVPRDLFSDCVNNILDDCNKAIKLLPFDYKEHTIEEIPQEYIDMGVDDVSVYDRVNGSHMKGRITGRIVEAIMSQVVLLASSPAFVSKSGFTPADAAIYASNVLKRINFKLPENGYKWFTEMENVSGGNNPDEIIWRSNNTESNTLEGNNYPPTLFGKGNINPTQNLVDAFPMKNGYPISDKINSGYNEKNPYSGRDERLKAYIIYDGSTMAGKSINTRPDGGTNDGLNKQVNYSTKTGYYLRKLLREDCNLDPKFNTKKKHFTAYIRYTEIFLNFAEAANEAWGPLDDGGCGYNAYQIVKMIRERAGIADGGTDSYLESIKSDKQKMSDLIKNERRLELCFENHRFWDLRRWKDDLNATAKGVRIENNTYNYFDVENRVFKEYMYYGPIPRTEIMKFDELVQNKGW